MDKKRVIIAGAEGFIGTELSIGLKNAGYEITALTDKAEEVPGADRTITSNGREKEEIVQQLRPFGYNGFFCLAWRGTSGPERGDCRVQTQNITNACMYADIAADAGCEKFIFASSISEYESYECVVRGSSQPARGCIYGAAKLAAHMMTASVAAERKMPFINVMFTNVYGEKRPTERLISSSVEKLLDGRHCAFTKGEQTYDFIYITDAVGALIAVLRNGRPSEEYYIGSGHPAPLKEFLVQMKEEVAPGAVIGLGEIPFTGKGLDYGRFDIGKVKRDTGYENTVSFREGIRMTARYAKERRNLDKSRKV